MDAHHALVTLGGVARYPELRRCVTRRAIERALASGTIVRAARGVYAVPDCPRMDLLAAMVHGRVGCLSLARGTGLIAWGVERHHLVLAPDQTQGGRHVRVPPDVTVHRAMPGEHPFVEMLAHAARCVDRRHLLALADATLATGLIHPQQLVAASGPRSRLGWVARHADARSGSPLESLARHDLVAARLAFESQVAIPTVGRVDFLVHGRVIVELDGRTFHSDAAAFARDRARDRAAAALGYVTLRFTWDDMRRGIARDVRAALAAPRLR